MTKETITDKYRINWSFSNICFCINALNQGCSESEATEFQTGVGNTEMAILIIMPPEDISI